MATGTKRFSVADIERYQQGLLSPKERHDLERAALDDPFLADALEGFAVAGQTLQADLDDLQSRLGQRIQGAAIIDLEKKKRNPRSWMRIAALLVLIVGLAFLANQFIFKKTKKDGELADARIPSKTSTSPGDTALNGVAHTAGSGVKTGETGITPAQPEKISEKPNPTPGQLTKLDNDRKDLADGKNQQPGNSTVTGGKGVNILDENSKTKITKSTEKVSEDVAIAKKTPDTDADGVSYKVDKDIVQPGKAEPVTVNNNRRNTEARNISEDFYRGNQSITFRGRVTDTNNVGVPFANVTNAQDNNAGTYTDAQGNFVLTYPDSVLTVQVRSIGFESRNIELKNTTGNNQVVLLDDRKGLSEVVLSKQRPNAVTRYSRDNNVKLQEPEPADGWENYDAYLANNLNAPEEIRNKPVDGGQVQVSFEVNQYGEPVNIKIEKSLCSKCNEEAIRLIKAGPKWKRNTNKKARTTVTVNF